MALCRQNCEDERKLEGACEACLTDESAEIEGCCPEVMDVPVLYSVIRMSKWEATNHCWATMSASLVASLVVNAIMECGIFEEATKQTGQSNVSGHPDHQTVLSKHSVERTKSTACSQMLEFERILTVALPRVLG